MPSTALYTDVASVARALSFQSPETLQNAVAAGAQTITLNQAPPDDWQVGSQLVLDSNNASLAETVTITAPPNGAQLTVSATVNSHVAGAPVVNGTILSGYIGPTSRWFDNQTFVRAGFAYEAITETKDAYIDENGYLLCPLSKPVVKLADVTSGTFQASLLDPADTLDLTKARIVDDYFLQVVPPRYYAAKTGQMTVSYSGGFNPVPDDLKLAVTMMAARFYKERDSGYADVIGSSETGIFQYKKAMPADIRAIVDRYRRWTV